MIDTHSCEYCGKTECSCLDDQAQARGKKRYKDREEQRRKSDAKARRGVSRNKR